MKDVIAARLYSRKDFGDLAKYASVPVINLLDDYGHPCQIMADFQTISEKKGIPFLSLFVLLLLLLSLKSFLLSSFFSFLFFSSPSSLLFSSFPNLLCFILLIYLVDLTKKLKISYFGDGENNVTYELMRMCAIYGFDIFYSSFFFVFFFFLFLFLFL